MKTNLKKALFFLGVVLIGILVLLAAQYPDGVTKYGDRVGNGGIVIEKILIGGLFTKVGGNDHANIARLNADGSEDAAFTIETNGPIQAVDLTSPERLPSHVRTSNYSEISKHVYRTSRIPY